MAKKTIIDEVLEASVSSAQAEPMRLKQGDKDFVVRSQLHTMILASFGFGKSSSLLALDNCVEVNDYSLPGIVGTISKDGDFVDGMASAACGKTLLVDEFHNLTSKSRNALLSLLEEQKYGRNLGYKVKHPIKKNKKFFKFYAKGNVYKIKYARFSCICSGLYMGRKKANDKAFLSRFMPIRISLDFDEAYDLSMGKKVFSIKSNPYTECPYFEDYEKFWKEKGMLK